MYKKLLKTLSNPLELRRGEIPLVCSFLALDTYLLLYQRKEQSLHGIYLRDTKETKKDELRLILPVVHLLSSLLNIAHLLLSQRLHHVALHAAALLHIHLLPSQHGHPLPRLVQVRVPCTVDPLPGSLKHWPLSLFASHPVFSSFCLKLSAVFCCSAFSCGSLLCVLSSAQRPTYVSMPGPGRNFPEAACF